MRPAGRRKALMDVLTGRVPLFHAAGGLFDKGGYGIWVRDIDSVAARFLNDVAPTRFGVNCCAGYGIILSSRACRYELA